MKIFKSSFSTEEKKGHFVTQRRSGRYLPPSPNTSNSTPLTKYNILTFQSFYNVKFKGVPSVVTPSPPLIDGRSMTSPEEIFQGRVVTSQKRDRMDIHNPKHTRIFANLNIPEGQICPFPLQWDNQCSDKKYLKQTFLLIVIQSIFYFCINLQKIF